jgi:hypothetical protein
MECDGCKKNVHNVYRDEYNGNHVNFCKDCHDITRAGGKPIPRYNLPDRIKKTLRAWRWLHRCVRDMTLTNSGGTWTVELDGKTETGDKLSEVLDRIMKHDLERNR